MKLVYKEMNKNRKHFKFPRYKIRMVYELMKEEIINCLDNYESVYLGDMGVFRWDINHKYIRLRFRKSFKDKILNAERKW